MVIDKTGNVTSYTQNDLNHCSSSFEVYVDGEIACGDCTLYMALCIRQLQEEEGHKVDIKPHGTIITWDSALQRERVIWRDGAPVGAGNE